MISEAMLKEIKDEIDSKQKTAKRWPEVLVQKRSVYNGMQMKILKSFYTLNEAMDWIDNHVDEGRYHVIIDKDIHSGMFHALLVS